MLKEASEKLKSSSPEDITIQKEEQQKQGPAAVVDKAAGTAAVTGESPR